MTEDVRPGLRNLFANRLAAVAAHGGAEKEGTM